MDEAVLRVHTCTMTRRQEALLIITAGLALAGVLAMTSLSWLWLGLVR